MRTVRTVVMALAIALGASPAIDAQQISGQVHLVTVARGDTLHSLGARFGVEAATIAHDNGRSLDAPIYVGETLRIDNRHIVQPFPEGAEILVNVPQRMVFAMSTGGIAAYPAAVGRASWPTPLGTFAIASRETNPTWDVPESIRREAARAGRSLPLRVPPGPQNPLGAHWLGLGMGGIGIHGTNAPASIYKAVTHGCIRLHPDDITALFGSTQIGTKGVLIYQPVLLAVVGDEIFVEAHRDIYGREPGDALELVRAQARDRGVVERIDWALAARVVRERAGIARVVSE